MLSGLLGEGIGVGMVCVMLELLVPERDKKFNTLRSAGHYSGRDEGGKKRLRKNPV